MFFRQLDNKISTLEGVGKAICSSYNDAQIHTWADLIQLAPRDFEDRSRIISLKEVPIDEENTVYVNTVVTVLSHSYFGNFSRKGRTLKIILLDLKSNKRLSLLCFGRNFLSRSIHVNNIYYFYGTVVYNHGEYQSSQFELKNMEDENQTPPSPFRTFRPIYPLRGSLSQRIIRRDISYVLKNSPSFEDELPQFMINKLNLMHTNNAIRAYHNPKNREDWEKAKKTLAITELFYMQIVARKNHFIADCEESIVKSISSNLENTFIADLPFRLTNDQMKVLKEIRTDLDSSKTMNRMLQGDVGSGKTLIAWITSLHVISKGYQVAFMAPTELLANQHYKVAQDLLEKFNIRTVLLTGALTQKQRQPLLEEIENGTANIIIGTHALFSASVKFKNLKYIIIDEQHRFGVEQRQALLEKANAPDILMMSATPIPRTLALTVYGDLNISTIMEKPIGRKEITTYLVNEKDRSRMYKSIAVEFKRGHQAYFVYPRIDDSGPRELRDVTNMFEYLKKVYPNIPSALLHSKIKEEDKLEILNKFKNKEITYLVSTSVIEVGIDIPSATCMIIEHADIFGLAALHQLRGRVGRSSLQSYCFLVYSDEITDLAKKRLKAMKETNDGFILSEKDLLLRGPGDITGTRQSGFLKLHFSSLVNDTNYILIARKYCDGILKIDSTLQDPRFKIINKVLEQANPFEEEEQENK